MKKIKTLNDPSAGQTVFVNESAKAIDSIPCFVPVEITNIMSDLLFYMKGNEYSIFCPFEYDKEEEMLVVGKKFFVPRQIVSGGAVDYKEDAPRGFSCVIHRHPAGMRRFSVTDENYINANFDLSLLWTDNEFVLGVFRIKTPYGMISIDVDIMQERIRREIPINIINKIEVSKPKVHRSAGFPVRHDNFGLGAFGFDPAEIAEYGLLNEFFDELSEEEQDMLSGESVGGARRNQQQVMDIPDNNSNDSN